MTMEPLGKTIRLFLVDGSPSGIITAEIMNWTGKVLSLPRGLLPQALKRSEIAKTGVYFLVGPDPSHTARNLVYVGETDDVAKRLKQHDADEKKDFFEQVVLIVSKDENLTKAHVRYLETRLIEIIQTVGMAKLVNGTQGSPVVLPESEQHDMEYVLQQLRVLLPVLGLTFLQEPPKRSIVINVPTVPLTLTAYPPTIEAGTKEASPTFELSFLSGQIYAEAYESEGQFVVMAGAICRHPEEATKPLKLDKYAYIMDDLKNSLESGLLTIESDIPKGFVKLNQDKAFNSPSRAALFVCANPMSGPTYWKVKETGQTYGEWRKAQFEEVEYQEPVREEVPV